MVLEESNVIAREMNEVKWDIDFQNLNYQVNTWCSGRRKYKDILRDVHGEFRGRELTAVIGQSGSGKSSLLNVLSGYTTKNVSGTIRLNGRNDVRGIRNRSKFIMQNYSLHNYITVEEAMMFAANLKLREVNQKTRRRKITSLLDLLGLGKVLDRYSGDLSGGEQKRLSIALELIDDPQILFLDEPTTGLDSSSSTQCIKLLKRLAVEGKTIICSLHTPSAIIFELFDNVYTIADGCCIYQGPSSKLIPFLSELDLTCPETFSPADFLLEIANNDYGMQNSRLTEKIKNGIISTRQMTQRKLSNYHDDNLSIEFNHSMELKKFLHELFQLLRRNFLISSRDKTMTQMRLGIHLTLAIFIGLMYSGIGDDASNILNIYRFLFFNIFFLMFTAFSSLQTSFPLDLPIIQREHFNLWYSTASYYSALLIADIPIIMSTNFIYIVITYFMTHQPMDIFRFSAYYMVILVLSIAAQGLGLIAGSLLNVKFTLILGSFFICPFVLFSNFFVQMRDTHQFWHWLFEFSFVKHALSGSLQAIFGYDREKMKCDVEYCHYSWPHKFLESLGISDSLPSIVIKLVSFAFIFRFVAFVIIWYRLKR